MKLPNWFKVAWWALLLVLLTAYLGQRYYSDLRFGRSIPVDVVVFLVWFGLLLAPLFNEINFFGLKLKQQIESLRRELVEQVQTLKSEIQNTVQVNPSITIAQAPPDSQLPKIEQEIKRVLDQRLKDYGISEKHETGRPADEWQNISDDLQFLFKVRYSIERELRRCAGTILEEHTRGPLGRAPSFGRLLALLLGAEILDDDLARAIRQVYAVCSTAIHGEDVSPTKVKFVRDVAPELLTTLRRLRETAELQRGPRLTPERDRAMG
jgi:hypothetical protein